MTSVFFIDREQQRGPWYALTDRATDLAQPYIRLGDFASYDEAKAYMNQHAAAAGRKLRLGGHQDHFFEVAAARTWRDLLVLRTEDNAAYAIEAFLREFPEEARDLWVGIAPGEPTGGCPNTSSNNFVAFFPGEDPRAGETPTEEPDWTGFREVLATALAAA